MPLVLQPPLLDLYGNYEYGEQLDEGDFEWDSIGH
jgi:hypothetical protein